MPEFVLKDWYGKEKTFDKETIYVKDTEGNLQPFTHGTGNPVLQDKTITENGTYTADGGYDGLGMVTVDVKGGGGGLPVGGYWAPFDEIPKPNSYNWNFFELGGELYAFASKTASSVGTVYRFKMENGAWVQLADETFVDCTLSMLNAVELNGKLHFIARNENKYHWTFDGSVMEQKNNVPVSIYTNWLFVQDGKLKCHTPGYPSKIYVWDEASDTWSQEATISHYNGMYFTIDGVVYFCADNNVYIYANNTFTLHCTVDRNLRSTYTLCVANGKVYFYETSNTTGSSLYCFDPSTKVCTFITKVPTHHDNGACYLKSYKNKVLSLPHDASYGSIFQLYEVTE